MPAPWQDTPIIALFGPKFNDYLMRVQSSVYTSYAVPHFKLVIACGSKVRAHFLLFVFALCERENEQR